MTIKYLELFVILTETKAVVIVGILKDRGLTQNKLSISQLVFQIERSRI